MSKGLAITCAAIWFAAETTAISADAPTNRPPAQSRVQQEGALSRENLTDEQRNKMREANEKYRAEHTTLTEKLRKARRELEQTAQADFTNEKAVREKASILAQFEADAAILRAKHTRELRAVVPGNSATTQVSPGSSTNPFSQRLESVVRRAPATNNAPRPVPVAK